MSETPYFLSEKNLQDNFSSSRKGLFAIPKTGETITNLYCKKQIESIFHEMTHAKMTPFTSEKLVVLFWYCRNQVRLSLQTP